MTKLHDIRIVAGVAPIKTRARDRAHDEESEDYAPPKPQRTWFSFYRTHGQHAPWNDIMGATVAVWMRHRPKHAPIADGEELVSEVLLRCVEYLSEAYALDIPPTWPPAEGEEESIYERREEFVERREKGGLRGYAYGVAYQKVRDYRSGKRRKGLVDPASNGRKACELNHTGETESYAADGGEKPTGIIPRNDTLPIGLENESAIAAVDRLARLGYIAEDLIIAAIDHEREAARRAANPDPVEEFWSDLRSWARIRHEENTGAPPTDGLAFQTQYDVLPVESSDAAAAVLLLATGYRPPKIPHDLQPQEVVTRLADRLRDKRRRMEKSKK